MGTPLPAPKNRLVEIVNLVLDQLIKGLGADAAIAAAIAHEPWLAIPIIKWIFTGIVHAVAAAFDTNAKRFVDIWIVRFQDGAKKAEYDKEMGKFKGVVDDETKTPAERAQARKDASDAIDRIVHRGDP